MAETVVNQDYEAALHVMRDASAWMASSGKHVSDWWALEHLNAEWLSEFSHPSEYFCLFADGEPAAAAVFQFDQAAQDWAELDRNGAVPAIYVHWLCVARPFAGSGKPSELLAFGMNMARERGVDRLRVDTNAAEPKLRAIYEDLGFTLVGEVDEKYRVTAFYQRSSTNT